VSWLRPRRDGTPATTKRLAGGGCWGGDCWSRCLGHGLQDVMVAKVEVTVNGGPPPDGRSVRYLDLMRSVDGRWLVVADSDAYHYMISLLSPALPKPGR